MRQFSHLNISQVEQELIEKMPLFKSVCEYSGRSNRDDCTWAFTEYALFKRPDWDNNTSFECPGFKTSKMRSSWLSKNKAMVELWVECNPDSVKEIPLLLLGADSIHALDFLLKNCLRHTATVVFNYFDLAHHHALMAMLKEKSKKHK